MSFKIKARWETLRSLEECMYTQDSLLSVLPPIWEGGRPPPLTERWPAAFAFLADVLTSHWLQSNNFLYYTEFLKIRVYALLFLLNIIASKILLISKLFFKVGKMKAN